MDPNNVADYDPHCIEAINYYTETLNVERALVIAPSAHDAKQLHQMLSELDYPCSLEEREDSRFLLMNGQQLHILSNLQIKWERYNVLFAMKDVDMCHIAKCLHKKFKGTHTIILP